MKNKVSNLILISLIIQSCVSTIPVPQSGNNTGTGVPVSQSGNNTGTVSPKSEQPTSTPLPVISALPTTSPVNITPSPLIIPQNIPSSSPTLSTGSDLRSGYFFITTIEGDSYNNSTKPDVNIFFLHPLGVTLDLAGNIYVADTKNHRIKKISPERNITTIAGTVEGFSDGVDNKAQFSNPSGIAIDSENNLYIADTGNNRIRKITFDGIVSTFSGKEFGMNDGGVGIARFNQPRSIIVDREDNFYVSDNKNSAIRKISTFNVNTLAGGVESGYNDAVGTEARFSSPQEIAKDEKNNIYVADSENHVIRKITPEGRVTTLAGSVKNPGFANGTGTNARFNSPRGITYDVGGYLYVSDTLNHMIRKVTLEGVVTLVAGTKAGYADGSTDKAMFNQPVGITSDLKGNIFVADSENNRIRELIFVK